MPLVIALPDVTVAMILRYYQPAIDGLLEECRRLLIASDGDLCNVGPQIFSFRHGCDGLSMIVDQHRLARRLIAIRLDVIVKATDGLVFHRHNILIELDMALTSLQNGRRIQLEYHRRLHSDTIAAQCLHKTPTTAEHMTETDLLAALSTFAANVSVLRSADITGGEDHDVIPDPDHVSKSCLMMMSAYEATLQLLHLCGVDRIGHSGRTLYSHLMGTFHLLLCASLPLHVCLGGALHSIYGTNKFGIATIPATTNGRTVIQSIIGMRAERLVYVFHSIQRPLALERAAVNGQGMAALAHRQSSIMMDVSQNELLHLRLIEYANLVEQLDYKGLHSFPIIMSTWLSQSTIKDSDRKLRSTLL